MLNDSTEIIIRAYWNSTSFNATVADGISDEAAETAYASLNSMNAGTGMNLNAPPTLTNISSLESANKVVTFGRTAADDGAIASTDWNFGDGTTGTYLVRCRVTDNQGARNSKWKLITVTGITTGIESAAELPGIVVYSNNKEVTLTISSLNNV